MPKMTKIVMVKPQRMMARTAMNLARKTGILKTSRSKHQKDKVVGSSASRGQVSASEVDMVRLWVAIEVVDEAGCKLILRGKIIHEA